jgi:hypothetical protein
MSKFLKSALKTALYLIDQFPDEVDRVSNRVSSMTERGRKAIYGEEDHTLRSLLSFAAGVGLGVGAGLLFAPASGEELRDSVLEKVHAIGDKVRDRVSSEGTSGGIKTP